MEIHLINYVTWLKKDPAPPLGLLYLAGYAGQKGNYEINLFDSIVHRKPYTALMSYLKNLDGSRDLILCFSMSSFNRFEIQEITNKVKKMFPNCIVIVGGPHVTLCSDETLRYCPGIDVIVRGEGEETFLQILNSLKNKFSVNSLKGVEGTSIRLKDDKIVHNPRRERIRNLDEIPFPDRRKIDMSKYSVHFSVKEKKLEKRLKITTMMGSRGCPYQCVFCSVADQWGRFTTYRSPENIIEEIKLLNKEYGYNGIYFYDDTFTLNRERVIRFCKLMREINEEIYWFCEVRANTVDEELLKSMYEGGCRSISMGIESGNQEILDKSIKKGIKLEDVRGIIRSCKKIGIHINGFFSFSHINETFEDAMKTIDFIREEMPDSAGYGKMLIFPGTPLFNYAKTHNMLPTDFNWFKKYPFYDTFVNNSLQPNFKHKLTDEQMAILFGEFNSIYYRKIDYIKEVPKIIKKVKSFKDLNFLVKGVLGRIKHKYGRIFQTS